MFNEYGPTETTVWCSVFDTADCSVEGPVPIGRPIAGTRLYLLDGEGRPVPVGVPLEGVCLDVTGGSLGCFSPVIRFAAQ